MGSLVDAAHALPSAAGFGRLRSARLRVRVGRGPAARGIQGKAPAGSGPSGLVPAFPHRCAVGAPGHSGFSLSVWGRGSARQRARRPQEAQVSASPCSSEPPPSGCPFPENVVGNQGCNWPVS